MKSKIETELKKKNIENLSEGSQKTYKLNTINNLIKDVENKDNRYLFYCPDIAIVNPLVKLIYEVAYQVKQAGYKVTVLHEVNGFKAKWLYETEDYKQYRELDVEYIINKVSKKSKREKNLYTFRMTDTLILPDAYQDMLMNIMAEESLRLMQKIVLVTGYMGIAGLPPGVDYDKLNVNGLVFFDRNIMLDYESMFKNTKNYILDTYPVSAGFRSDRQTVDEVAPVILLSAIGNNEKAQELINIFYNKYPNLNMFSFKIVAREDMDVYINNIASSAAYVILDKNIVTKQMVYEVLNMGVPVVLPTRREFLDSQIIIENFCVEDDTFLIAEQIANFCSYWLEAPTGDIKNSMLSIAKSLDLESRTVDTFRESVSQIFGSLQENREKTFTNIKENLV